MEVRLATKDDKRSVLALLDELGEEINKKSGFSARNAEAQKVGGAMFDAYITGKDSCIFVAEEKGILFGLISFYILPNMRHGEHRGHVEDMVVSESARGKGVGTKLFTALKE